MLSGSGMPPIVGKEPDINDKGVLVAPRTMLVQELLN
jgi:hypothetical protein